MSQSVATRSAIAVVLAAPTTFAASAEVLLATASGGSVAASGQLVVVGQPLTGTAAGLDVSMAIGFVPIVIASPIPILGDLDGNGVVDGADLGLLLSNWNESGIGDLNADGIVDGSDLGLLLANWG
ncbi:MAG: hypothetical protein KDA22_12870 [Phycisphaerales bacterium]|nr:hypothetical protein [Phycisphaerales bacterium]